MADHLALLNMPMNALKRSATTTSFDPLTILPALAVMTERLGLIAGGYGGLSFTGTPKTIADQMEEWLSTDACDGFNIMFPYVPGGPGDFVNMVVPELQRRGLFGQEYEGQTLRKNLGLPKSANRFFPVG